MTSLRNTRLLRWGLVLFSVINVIGILFLYFFVAQEIPDEILISFEFIQATFWIFLIVSVLLAVFAWLGGAQRVFAWLNSLVISLDRIGRAIWLVMVGLAAVFPLLVFGRFGIYFSNLILRLNIFLWIWLWMSICMRAYWRRSWPITSVSAALVLAAAYHLATYFPHVTNYPFALWWSETTRYYMASTFFDQRIYGQDLPLVFRDFTRYLIQAVPFIVPGTPIWVHRLWQVILRFSAGYLAGAVLARRLNLRAWMFGILSAWAGLYFFQGPVFYNLIVIVIVVFWFVDVRKFWKTLLMVALVSIYAGFSRINWVPMAGLMAAMFYFLKVPVAGRDAKSVFRYLRAPAIWVLVGLGIGVGAQQILAVNSGNPPEIYYSSFTSYLLWKRLFPNPSYPIGILPNILLITAPLLLYLTLNLRKLVKRMHLIRLLALAAIAGALFVGGLLVSIKIGGGTNLHNMDVFLVALLIIAVELYFQRSLDESGQVINFDMPDWLKTAVIAVPIIFTITFGGLPSRTIDQQSAYQDLARLQKYADQAVAAGGDVLFMSQRHLLTFDYIKDVPLIHAHEKLLLQEMAMSDNDIYLAAFAEEMAEQRYALIVSDLMPSDWQNPQTKSLAMENNVVLRKITPLITCAYQVEELLLEGELAVWTPQDEVTCPLDKE